MKTGKYGHIFALSLLSLAALATSAPAQVVVYDPSNYAQNILQAARALQQVKNQIQSLSNEATMILDMAKHLKSLDLNELTRLNTDIAAINQLMASAKGIALTVSQTEAAFSKQFPASYADVSAAGLAGAAQTRWQSAMAAFSQTLNVQARITENLNADAGTLNDLVNASQGAVGDLQARQAGNQLLALTAKQNMEIASLLIAQSRAEALDAARKAQGEEAARAYTQAFIGDGPAYTAP